MRHSQAKAETIRTIPDPFPTWDLRQSIPSDLIEYVGQQVDRRLPELISIRRHIHMHPELSRMEHKTTELLLDVLQTAGLQPKRLSSGTGLICDVGMAYQGSPVIALRADIDALGLPDATTSEFRSQVENVSHACGHDVHTCVCLGAGLVLQQVLADSRWGLAGGVRLIFEPSEEKFPSGALDVIADGGLDGVRAVFGLHCDPSLDVGALGCRVGAITSAADGVGITVRGPGGHTARPDATVDLVAAVGTLTAGLQRALDARTGEAGALRVVFGSVHAGDAPNVIPSQATVTGTARTRDAQVHAAAQQLVSDAIEDLLTGTGATWHVDYRPGTPPVVNDAEATDLLAAAGATVLGSSNVRNANHSLGADSFSFYLADIPGSYGRLGVHDPASATYVDLHSSEFDVHEDAIRNGICILVLTALAALTRPSVSSH